MYTAEQVEAAAAYERGVLLAQAARQHLDNVRSEADRYAAELEHIDRVHAMRVSAGAR